jgi:hypothetical protein
MIVSDLNFVQQPASLSGGLICFSSDRFLTPEEFQFVGLVVISYEEEEEPELVNAGLLSVRRSSQRP